MTAARSGTVVLLLLVHGLLLLLFMCGSRKFCQRGSNFRAADIFLFCFLFS